MIELKTSLTEKEREETDNIIPILLNEIFIVKDKDAPSKQRFRTLQRAEVNEYVSEILKHCGKELIIRDMLGVAFICDKCEKEKEFKKDETIFILRLYQASYNERVSQSGQSCVPLEKMKEILKNDGIDSTKKKMEALMEPFKKRNIISYDKKEELITVWPSIRCVIDNMQLEEVASYISSLNKANKQNPQTQERN